MRNMTRRILGASALGIVFSAAWASSMVNGSAAHGQEKAKQTRWEYRVILANARLKEKSSTVMTEQFNELASEGWEYVGPVAESSETRNIPTGYYLEPNGAFVLFKRLK
jgi:hypothetical protein